MLTNIQPSSFAHHSAGEPVKVSDLLAAFLSGRSPRTLKAYGQDLADFRVFSKVKTTEDAARGLLSQGHGRANLLLLEYRTSLTARGLQSATISRSRFFAKSHRRWPDKTAGHALGRPSNPVAHAPSPSSRLCQSVPRCATRYKPLPGFWHRKNGVVFYASVAKLSLKFFDSN
jgi:hypothetical protein